MDVVVSVVGAGVAVVAAAVAVSVELSTRRGGAGAISWPSGGVTALPTLSNCPPKSNEFMEAIASCADCNESYSMKP